MLGLHTALWVSLVVVTKLLCLRHVGSSQTRDRSPVLCIVRQILNHWTSSEAPGLTDFDSTSLQRMRTEGCRKFRNRDQVPTVQKLLPQV